MALTHDDPFTDLATDAERIARLERALLSSRDGFWERNLRTNQSWYSNSFRTMFGFAPDELPNDRETINARIHRDDIDGFLQAYDEAIRKLSTFTYELRFLDKQERWRWCRGRARVFAGADGQAELIAGALSDVHHEKEALLALERMTDRFEHAVAAADAGLFERMIDDDEMYISDRLWRLLGYEPGDLPALRSTLVHLIHPDDLPRYARDATAAHKVLGRLTSVVRLKRKNGDYRWFRQDAQPHRLPDGRLRVTGVIADVHEQVLAREALERHREQLEREVQERTARLEAALAHAEQRHQEAERANAAKSRFLAHMSHEMRTPLNGALGLTELALRVATMPTQRRYLEVALQSGQALLQVINDVLDVSRLESGRIEVHEEPFDLADALAEVMRSVMPLVSGKGLTMRYDWVGARTWVCGDAARVRQIATNLLGNAVKFTERGFVQVVAEIVDTGPRQCRATLRFEDSGPGLEAEQIARVFDAFEQGDPSLSRRHGGTGLGLAIASGWARALGGELTVQSEPGRGSTFTLVLPFGTADDPHPLQTPQPGRAWLLYTLADRGDWMKRRIERLGWQADIVPGVPAAIERARTSDVPHLVVVDQHVLVPGIDLPELRAALPKAAITLLVRPDWADTARERQALALGMTLMVLPLTPRDLCVMAAAGASSAAAAQPPTEAGPAGHVLLVEDNPTNRMIGEEFLHALGLAVKSAENGEVALAACRAEPPTLVLMDLQMPVLDGLEATRRLRALQAAGQLPHFPIVALTAHAMEADAEQCRRAGMDGYLTKPIMLDRLKRELARWLPELV